MGIYEYLKWIYKFGGELQTCHWSFVWLVTEEYSKTANRNLTSVYWGIADPAIHVVAKQKYIK